MVVYARSGGVLHPALLESLSSASGYHKRGVTTVVQPMDAIDSSQNRCLMAVTGVRVARWSLDAAKCRPAAGFVSCEIVEEDGVHVGSG